MLIPIGSPVRIFPHLYVLENIELGCAPYSSDVSKGPAVISSTRPGDRVYNATLREHIVLKSLLPET